MIYLPRDVRRAMNLLAASRGCRISDLYTEAATRYLKSQDGSEEFQKPEPTMSEVAWASQSEKKAETDLVLKRLDGYARMLSDIKAQTADLVPSVGPRPLAIVITALAQAGSAGLETSEVRALMTGEGFPALKPTTVRDELVQAGVARYQAGRWYIRDVSPSSD